MMFSDKIEDLARQVLERARTADLRIAVAESCTGGLVAASLCAVPGASDVFDRGFITYSNAAKTQMLGVPVTTLDGFGAVSEPTARAMARGVLAHSPADIAVSTTGIAGPGGGGPDKPVGTVHLAVALRSGAVLSRREQFGDQSREAIQLASVGSALAILLEALA
jgi:nicotinamide-nucleotide amidase